MTSIKQNNSLFKIVVTHYLTAALCFLGLPIMMLFSVQAFTGHYFHPQILAVTHLAALGWGTIIIFGASYQLIPVVLETELYSNKLAWISFSFFLLGMVALIYSFWAFLPGIHMQCGAVLLLTAFILFTVNVYLTARKRKQSIQEDFIFTACLCLCITAAFGTAIVFNFTIPIFPQDQLYYLKIHAHLGIAGWFLLMIIGVSSKLVPMFLVSSRQNPKLLSVSYYLIVGALLLFVVDAYWSGITFRTYLIAFTGTTGIFCYLLFIFQCFKSRMRKKMDAPMVSTFLSFILLTLAIIIIPFIIYYHLKNNPVSIRYSLVYGILLFMGWITALILGQTFKTLPFIVWVKHYEHLTGKVKTPMPSDLFKISLLKIQSAGFVIFCIAFTPGVFFAYQPLMYAGAIALLVTAIIYLINMLVVFCHKTKTEYYDNL
jgi:hypothetical protein